MNEAGALLFYIDKSGKYDAILFPSVIIC